MTLRSCSVFAVALSLAGCADPPDREVFLLTPPSRETFAPVGYVFGAHCGTLDCHGDPARNLRVYGIQGLRLASNDVAGFEGTTDAELDLTFQSVIAIEPERLSGIVNAGGDGAEAWIVLGKGRGEQHHEGEARLLPGQPADTCVLLWLAGRFDREFEDACQQGGIVAPPGGEAW